MKQYKVPIDFTIKADSPEEAKYRLEEFLLQAVNEFRLTYGIIDYEAPYGFPTEEVPSS